MTRDKELSPAQQPVVADEVAGWRTTVGCPLCGDESVCRDVATMCDPLLLMVCESSRDDYMEHLRAAHPQEYSREHAREQEMNVVSTVWLGIDHGFATMFSGGPHVPVIFETMIFAPGDVRLCEDDDLDQYQERYATEAAAQAGHDRALAAMAEKLGGPDAAMEIMSAAQFTDTATAPDDPGELT